MNEVATAQVNGLETKTASAPAAEGAAPAAAQPPKTGHLDALAIVSKKEKALFAKEKAFKEREKAFTAREAELTGKLSTYETREKTWRDDPLTYLKDTGKSYQDVTERVLAGGERTVKDVEADLRRELEELKADRNKEKEEQSKSQKTQAEQEQQATVNAYKDTLREFIGENKGNLKLTAIFDGEAELIYDTIETHFNQTSEKDEEGNILKPGKILSNSEAAELVEKYFKSQLHEGMKLLGYPIPGEEKGAEDDKGSAGDANSPLAGANVGAGRPAPKTLNNSMGSSGSTLVSAKTDSERTARALAAMEAVEKTKVGRR